MSRSEFQDADREDVCEFVRNHWGSSMVMSSGRSFYPHKEKGFIEREDGLIVGLLSYRIEESGMEILTLNATLEGQGIGSSLMLNAIEKARDLGCDRIWLTTTNDNLRGIGFYQRLGFRMVTINLGAVDEARKIKPEIPKIGRRGVPIHDEIVMDLHLKPYLD
ncbi:MAG: GNAT family N-acetyltransferase [Planctomycetota bacterium]|jgi:ribosomal protein S18 acetylase RimI-like enzyme